MFRAQRHRSVGSGCGLYDIVPSWLVVVLPLCLVGGCETAAPWADPHEVVSQQEPEKGLGEEETETTAGDVPDAPPEERRTTIVCNALKNSESSSLKATVDLASSKSRDRFDGSWPICPPPPCEFEPSPGVKQGEMTVSFNINPNYFAAVLDEPMLTIAGVVDGGNRAVVSTETMGPLAPIDLLETSHTVTITVDTSEFVKVAGVALSWIPVREHISNAASAQTRQGWSSTASAGSTECP